MHSESLNSFLQCPIPLSRMLLYNVVSLPLPALKQKDMLPPKKSFNLATPLLLRRSISTVRRSQLGRHHGPSPQQAPHTARHHRPSPPPVTPRPRAARWSRTVDGPRRDVWRRVPRVLQQNRAAVRGKVCCHGIGAAGVEPVIRGVLRKGLCLYEAGVVL